PKITTHPLPQTVGLDGNATFSVAATGDSLSYQWQKDGGNIATATASSYTITGAQSSDQGIYTCVVSNTDASVTSNGAVLTVIIPPAITVHPDDMNATLGGPSAFNVTASGGNLTYQWQKNGVNITGATTASYSIPTTQSGHAGTYRCVVTNPAGSVASNGAVLTVITPPTITSQPANVVLVGSNTTATFSVTVTPGYGTTLSYQWQKNGADIGGATSATYTITDANSTHVGTYTCVVTNAGGAIVTSSTATLSFFSGTVIESFGNTSLLYNSQGYYLGGLSTPLTYGGTHLSPNSFLNYTVLAVEKVGGEYRALWKTPNGYWIERVGLNGSHKSFGPTFGAAQLR
ncbi:MAG: immunoglobulin domain-containing protein, partial [Chloroflexota bacterium]|nr:immunoglobulin domain-containing protein [Chloroflexota bacterium]